MSKSASPQVQLQHFVILAQQFKDENLTIPSKSNTIKSIKHALNHCTKDQLYLIADMLELPHKVSETRMKLNILDKTQQLIYGHVIDGWNTTARWGFVLVLYYLLAKIMPEGGVFHKNIQEIASVFIVIMSILGGYLALKFLVRFKQSWDMRRLIQLKMKEFQLVKSKEQEEEKISKKNPKSNTRPSSSTRKKNKNTTV